MRGGCDVCISDGPLAPRTGAEGRSSVEVARPDEDASPRGSHLYICICAACFRSCFACNPSPLSGRRRAVFEDRQAIEKAPTWSQPRPRRRTGHPSTSSSSAMGCGATQVRQTLAQSAYELTRPCPRACRLPRLFARRDLREASIRSHRGWQTRSSSAPHLSSHLQRLDAYLRRRRHLCGPSPRRTLRRAGASVDRGL